MAELLRVFVRGCPEPQPRPRGRLAGKGNKSFVQFYDAKTYDRDHPKHGQQLPWVTWRQAVTNTVLSQHRPMSVEGPIRLTLDFYYPRPQYLLTAKSPVGRVFHDKLGDCDNLQKLVQDVLTETKVWKDDGQVCEWQGGKYFVGKGAPSGCWIIVETLTEAEPVLFDTTGIVPKIEGFKQVEEARPKLVHPETLRDIVARPPKPTDAEAIRYSPTGLLVERNLRPAGRPRPIKAGTFDGLPLAEAPAPVLTDWAGEPIRRET